MKTEKTDIKTESITNEQYLKFVLNINNSTTDYGTNYYLLELLNEKGEVYGEVKKYLRDNKTIEEVKPKLQDEAGDMLWSYVKYLWGIKRLHKYLSFKGSYGYVGLTKENLLKETLTLRQETLYRDNPKLFLATFEWILNYFQIDIENLKVTNYKKLVSRTLDFLSHNAEYRYFDHFNAYEINIDYDGSIVQHTIRDNDILKIKRGNKQYIYNNILAILDDYEIYKRNLSDVKIKIKKWQYFLDSIEYTPDYHNLTGEQFVRGGVDKFNNLLDLGIDILH